MIKEVFVLGELDNFYRDTWAEINLNSLESNISQIKGLLNEETKIIAVVKANGYGHGDFECAKAALASGASCLAVAFLDEALALRNKGITEPILVLGATRPEDAGIAAKYKVSLTVFQIDWIKSVQEILGSEDILQVHIKIDTGMGRIGLKNTEELIQLDETIRTDKRLVIEGIYTHFATADELDDKYFKEQKKKFSEMMASLSVQPPFIHSSNSAAALMYPEVRFNAVRIGIAMYGLTPSIEIEPFLPIHLQEVFSLHSRIIHVKKLKKGEKVSYGATYTTEDEEWIGTIPIGYADGWIRRLQGQDVLIEGKRAPIVGRICMDQCMVKLPNYIPVGTKVTLIGKENSGKISMNEIAKKLETINYEIPCMISNRVPRVYKRDGKTIQINNQLLS